MSVLPMLKKVIQSCTKTVRLSSTSLPSLITFFTGRQTNGQMTIVKSYFCPWQMNTKRASNSAFFLLNEPQTRLLTQSESSLSSTSNKMSDNCVCVCVNTLVCHRFKAGICLCTFTHSSSCMCVYTLCICVCVCLYTVCAFVLRPH